MTVPFAPGRMDASLEQTDVDSFKYLEPFVDAMRNYRKTKTPFPAEQLMLDRTQLQTLTAPELAVLVGGMRSMGANHGGTRHGVFTDRPGSLNNDFFKTVVDMRIDWAPKDKDDDFIFEGRDRSSGEPKWTATRLDLVFGANSQLRALSEVYGADDAEKKFVNDFVAAWDKVMNLGRFDLG